MQTFNVKQKDLSALRGWYVVDATDKTLGRLAAFLAHRLRGKHKPEFSSFMDVGDYMIVVNAEKIRVTGSKVKDKLYHHHSGYPGGIKTIAFDKLLKKSPEDIIKFAVKGMLPKGPLGRRMLSKLKIYAGAQHPHMAQEPKSIESIGE